MFSQIRAGRVARNLAWLGGSSIITRILSYATLVVMAQRLEPDGYGLTVFTQTTVTYFVLLADFGLGIYGTRELARDRANAKHWAATILSARLMTTMVAACLLALYIATIPLAPLSKSLLYLYGLSLPLGIFTLEWLFQGLEEMRYVAIGRVAQAAVYLFLVVWFIRDRHSLMLAPVLLAVSMLVLNATLGIAFTRRFGLPKSLAARLPVADALRQSLPIGLSAIMIQVYYNADRILLGFIRSEAEVGWYDAAYRFVLLFTGIAALVAQAILPRLSALATHTHNDEIRLALRLAAKIMIYAGLPIALAGSMLAVPLVTLIYGPGYEPSAPVLQIIMWQVFTVFANVAFAQALLAFDHQKLYFYSVLSGAMINLALNAFLIPRYGMIGASLSTMAAEIGVLSLLYYFATWKVGRVPIIEPLAKAVLACAGLGIAILVAQSVFWQLLLGGAAYVLILALTRPFSEQEKQRLL